MGFKVLGSAGCMGEGFGGGCRRGLGFTEGLQYNVCRVRDA